MAALPYVSVQPNYPEVFADVASSSIQVEKIWLSYYSTNSPSGSVHTKLTLLDTKDDGTAATQGGVSVSDINVTGGVSNGLKVDRVDGAKYDLRVSTDSAPTSVETSEAETYNDDLGVRSARTRQSRIFLDQPYVQVRFASKALHGVLPTLSTSKINDNYNNYPTIDAFDVSPTTNHIFVAGGSEGLLTVGSLGDYDAAESRASLMQELSSADTNALCGDEGAERRIEVEAQLRMQLNHLQKGSQRRVRLTGHVGDIRDVKVFPSGKVILSTSSDLTTRIWDANTGENARTLQGHKRAVLTSGIVGRGRTVLTGGADGTIRHWDVAAPKQIKLFGSDRYSAVNCLALAPSQSEAEEQNLFVVGLNSGTWQQFDARTGLSTSTTSAFAFPPGPKPATSDLWQQAASKSITAIDCNDTTVVTGTVDGIVSVWDLRAVSSEPTSGPEPPKGLLTTWRRNNAEVTCLKLAPHTPNQGYEVLVATQDGLPYRASIEETHGTPRVTQEFGGWDCDPTSFIGTDAEGRIVIAGAEGRVRRY